MLKKGGVKKVQYFKGLFSSTNKKGKKKGRATTNKEDQFMKSGTGNLSEVVPLVGAHKYKVRGHSQRDKRFTTGKSFVIESGEKPTRRLLPYDLIPVFK